MKIEVITIVVITILSTYECKQQNNTNLPNDDEDLKMKWISENLMELTLYDGEIKNVSLTSSQDNQPDIDGGLDCIWTGRIVGDKSSIISVIGCMDSEKTIISMTSDFFLNGVVNMVIEKTQEIKIIALDGTRNCSWL